MGTDRQQPAAMLRSATLALLATSFCFAVDGWDRIESNQGSMGFALHSTTSSNVGLGPLDKSGRIDCDTFGLGLTFGGTVQPLQTRGRINLGIMPYVRFAIGSSDVYIRDLAYDDKTIDASGTVGRLDFGGGADVRLTIGRHIELAIGGGVNFWRSADIDAVSTEDGTYVRVSQAVDFSGRDTFLRASAGFSF
jgi:hypothetical protein